MFQYNFDAVVEILDGDVERGLVVTGQRQRLPAELLDGGDDRCARFGAQSHARGEVSERGTYAANQAFVAGKMQDETGMLRTTHGRTSSQG